MFYNFNLAYPYIFICLVISLLFLAYLRWFWWQPGRYAMAGLRDLQRQKIAVTSHISQKIFYGLRLASLLLIILAISRPQKVDPNSRLKVDGIDIMMVLDVSQSMLLSDDLNSFATRIAIAKKEAINFIDRRVHDPIGLVLFGRYALCRCPLTLDKAVLRKIVEQIEIGEIDPGGTFLAVGMATAINRLKNSTAKQRIMIVLTDGKPTPGDLDIETVINIANKFEIKIYTIGIGSQEGGFFNHPIFGPIRQSETFDYQLLQAVAQATGGQAFEVKNELDMRAVYAKIDQLEKSKIDAKMFTKKFDYFILILKLALLLLIIELFLSYFIWFGMA